jgi:Sulfotransferase domain
MRLSPVRSRASPGAAGGRFPDFFVVGHPKCGTTALYDMLSQHPLIYMSPVKEPRFFVSDDELRLPALRRTTLADYLRLFTAAGAEQRTGEASPQYLASHSAPGAIAAANPSARIIAILRDPASFIRSMHNHWVRRGIERPENLGVALAAGSSDPLWRYYEQRVRFVDQLERYRAVFPPDQVLVLIYDDYRSSNVDTVRRVFRFLHVDEEYEVAPRDLNAGAGVRSRVAAVVWHRLMLGQGRASASLGRAARAAVPHRGRDAVRAFYRRANLTAPPPIDDALMARLRMQFAPEVRKISDYLGRDLTGLWGYPDG